VGVLAAERDPAEDLGGSRADEGRDREVLTVADLGVATDPVHVEMPLRLLGRARGEDEQDRVRRQPEHAHVRPHLALTVEQGGVAPHARLERLDVVRDLPLEELGALGPAHFEDREVLASKTPRLLQEQPVFRVESGCSGHRGHRRRLYGGLFAGREGPLRRSNLLICQNLQCG
jgi:hypothetical protein